MQFKQQTLIRARKSCLRIELPRINTEIFQNFYQDMVRQMLMLCRIPLKNVAMALFMFI